MSRPDLFAALVETSLAMSVALLLVLTLRRALRHTFGATIAYAAWALVPVATAAVLLPAGTPTLLPAPVWVQVQDATVASGLGTYSGAEWATLACWVWMLGMLIAAGRLALQQRRFVRDLGAIRLRGDGLLQAETAAGLPAVIGLWRPAIVVPCDFDARYTLQQQMLMRNHEFTHIASGDLYANALVAVLRSLFWFNPLLHYAARHYRHDQELACDQRVIARHPQARRAYGEAMLNTQLAAHPMPLGCHWGYSHPLKERIEMLKHNRLTPMRWFSGSVLVAALILGTGAAAWAAQPEATRGDYVPDGMIRIVIVAQVGQGTAKTHTVIKRAGEAFSIQATGPEQTWRIDGVATVGKDQAVPQSTDDMVWLATALFENDEKVGTPKVAVHNGGTARIKSKPPTDSPAGRQSEGLDLKIKMTAATSLLSREVSAKPASSMYGIAAIEIEKTPGGL